MATLEVVEERLKEHIKTDEKRYERLEQHIVSTNDSIKKIKDNHLAHIQADMEAVKIKMAKDSIIVRFFWVIIGTWSGIALSILANAVWKVMNGG